MNTTGHNIFQRLSLFEASASFLAAYGCARAWTTLVVVQPNQLLMPNISSHQVFDLAYCLIAIVAFALANRLLPSLEIGKTCAKGSLVGMVAGSLLLIASNHATELSEPLLIASAIASGIGYILFLLSWSQALMNLSLVKIVAFTATSMFTATAIVYFVNGMDPQRLTVAMLLLPFVSFAALKRANPSNETPAQSFPSQHASLVRSYPWKLYLLFGIYSFAYGLHGETAAKGAGMHSSLSTAIISLAIVAFVIFSAEKASVRVLFRSPLPLLLSGFLLVLFPSFVGQTISSYLISMSYTLMSVIVTLILFDISKRLEIPIVALVSLKTAEQLFVLAGQWSYSALKIVINPAFFDATLTLLVLVIMVLQAIILRSERDLNSRWGVSLLKEGGLSNASDEVLRIASRCDEITAQYKLSPREDEILRLMAQGKTGKDIAQELFIAEGTYKAHTQHIYTKLGIHSKKELTILLGRKKD